MMVKIFLTFLEISVGISIVAVLLMLITPRTDKKYNSKWRYYLLIFITVRLLIPLNPAILNIKESLDISPNSIFSFESQPLTQLNIDISNMAVEEVPLLEMSNDLELIEKEKQYNSVDGRIMRLSEISMFQLVISLWIFGIIIHIIDTIIGYIIYRKKIIRWSSPILDGEFSEMVREISEDMGINKDIIPMEYRGEISPQIMGLLRNMMILPNNKLQEDELEFIIRHELAHLKSHHLWIKLLSTLTKTIHWFNPFVYYIADELEVEMEIKCDYEVTKKFNSERRRYYADMLIKLMEMEIVKCDGLTTSFGGGKRRMKKRLVNIVGKRNRKRGIIPFIVVFLVSVMVSGTIVFAKGDVKTLTERDARVIVNKMMENYNKESKLIQYENLRNEVIKPRIIIENLESDIFTANMTYSNKWGTTTNIILNLKREGKKWVITDEKYGPGLIYVHADGTEVFKDAAGGQVLHNMEIYKTIQKEKYRIKIPEKWELNSVDGVNTDIVENDVKVGGLRRFDYDEQKSEEQFAIKKGKLISSEDLNYHNYQVWRRKYSFSDSEDGEMIQTHYFIVIEKEKMAVDLFFYDEAVDEQKGFKIMRTFQYSTDGTWAEKTDNPEIMCLVDEYIKATLAKDGKRLSELAGLENGKRESPEIWDIVTLENITPSNFQIKRDTEAAVKLTFDISDVTENTIINRGKYVRWLTMGKERGKWLIRGITLESSLFRNGYTISNEIGETLVDNSKEIDVFKVIKGKTVEDPLIEKERERIAKICIKGKGGRGRGFFIITGELMDYNKDLFEVVNIKGTEKPKKIMNGEYSTTWDDIGNMIYSDYIFPKGKFTAEANGPFNICIYHEDGSIDIVSAVKSNDKYEVDIEVGDSYYVSIHNRRERYKDLSNTKYSFIPE